MANNSDNLPTTKAENLGFWHTDHRKRQVWCEYDLLDELSGNTHAEAQATLHKYFAKVPAGATNVRLEHDIDYSWSEGCDRPQHRLLISYIRPLTSEETAALISAKHEHETAQLERDRAELARLQARIAAAENK